ncbi:MAG: RagB/SusD family nutrient uptake outer membrane protein, partial [Bacteroidales bacterium]|nr:RagB/SusD family nutrient uptake outer membrane protein [Bacteroidales bacterium]
YEGIYIPELGKPFDMNGDGANDLCIYSDKKPTEVKGVTYVKIDGTGEQRINSRGCVEFGMQSVWLDYKYLHPVPKTAIDINKNLLPQNPGWDD